MNRRAQLICLWCGPLVVVLFTVGAALVGQIIPPFMDPSDSAAEVAALYADHTLGVRAGSLISIIALALIAPWGAVIAAQLRPGEGSMPVLTYLQIASIGAVSAIVAVICTFWTVTAFRPGEYPAEIVQYSNDVAYLMFVFTWPPFTIWLWASALATLLDARERPAYPRWTAFLAIWVGLLIVGGGASTFFKTGAFAYNGLLGLYLPLVAFFAWLITMTVLTLRNIRRDGPAVA